MSKLFIAEKPSAAKAIADGIGDARRRNGYFECSGGVKVSYCIGHLFSLEEPDFYISDEVRKNRNGRKAWRAADLPIVPDKWVQKPKKETKEQLDILGDLIKDSDEVVHAGDIDREGQTIVDDVLEYFKYSGKVSRFTVSAQDEVSIMRGLKNLSDNKDYEGWRLASQARSRADWLIGMNLTRSLTLEAQAKGDRSLLVVGRVQSPTLALVVNRDNIIKNFKPIDYYQIDVKIDTGHGDYSARWVPAKDAEYLDEDGRVVDKIIAVQVLDDIKEVGKASVVKYEVKPKRTPQPLGLSLSDITLIGSNKYGMTADTVLKVVQSLYEVHKICSYPRSDCSYLPLSQFDDAKGVLNAIAGTHPSLADIIGRADAATQSRVWDDKKVTAHHAIVPTLKKGNIDVLSEDERNIYDLIARNYVAQFLPRHEYDSTLIETEVFHSDGKYLLKTTGNTVTNIGWKEVYKEAQDKKQSDDVQNRPVVKVGDDVEIVTGKVSSKKTKPPSRFTEGTLIKALENVYKYVQYAEDVSQLKESDGIGTPATRSSIITELKRRNYLTEDGKYLVSTDEGQKLIRTLPRSMTSASMTAQNERILKEIQAGTRSLKSFLDSQIAYVAEQVDLADHSAADKPRHEESEHNCSCGSSLIRRKSNKGSGYWFGCSSYPECKNTYSEEDGKPVTAKKASKASGTETEHKCVKCDSSLIRRKSKKGSGHWFGCSGFPSCKETYKDKGGEPVFEA